MKKQLQILFKKTGTAYVDDFVALYGKIVTSLPVLNNAQMDEFLINHFQIRDLILTFHCHKKCCSHDVEIMLEINERIENIKISCNVT